MTISRSFLVLFLLASSVPAQVWEDREPEGVQKAREDWFFQQRVQPSGIIPTGARVNAIRRQQQIDSAARQQHQSAAATGMKPHALTMDSANWTLIGPRPTGGGSASVTSGRVNAIAIDPRSNNVAYIGAAEGGVWKTTDGGAHWTPLTDNQASLASGAIAIDPNNPDTVYVGTGEENFAYDSYYGAGILKSTDGGATWTNIVGPFLRDEISAIAVHPTNSNILVCTSRVGVWRSADAGQNWTLTLSGTGGISATFDPTNGSSVYASLGYPTAAANSKNGVYHSTDGGITWKAVNGSGTTALPTTNLGRINIAMAPSDPATIYAQVGNATNQSVMGIYKTIDGAASWNKLPISSGTLGLWGDQAFYDNPIAVSPSDPNVVWAGGLNVMRSTDGGNTWSALPMTGLNGTTIHVDFHVFAFTQDGTRLYIGNDGGVFSTGDVTGRQVNWAELNDTLAITQFYPGMTTDPTNPLVMLGGTQDNRTQRYNGDANWQVVACGDGAYTVIDPLFPALTYTNCGVLSGAAILRTLALTVVSAWVETDYGIDQTDLSPFIGALVMDPSNPQTLYYGTYRLWQTQDSAGKWNPVSPDLTGGKKGTVFSIGVAPTDSNTVYVGTSNGKVQVTRDVNDGANASWTAMSGLPSRTPTQVRVDWLDAATAYVTFSGFSSTTDKQGHIFKTQNAGASWADISGNLPNVPVNDLVVDPDLPQTLYAATDIGVLVTTDGGNTWSTLGNGLPKVAVPALVFDRGSRVMRAGTHGRSVWEILVPLTGASQQPSVTALSPVTANTGDPAFTLKVTGARFTSGTVIRWNGQNRPTTLVDSGHATAQIPATDIAGAGRVSITAFNPGVGGGASNPVNFTVGSGPQATSKSVVSAANPLGGNQLAQRSIATIYGVNLAGKTEVADIAPPLPITLGGATVILSVGSSSSIAPLFYVSPTQISFQVPLNNPVGTQTLTITQGTQSVTVPVQIVVYAPAIFTTNNSGSGQAAVLIANTATITAPKGAFADSRPAHIGEYISIFCTGLGDVSPRPALGAPSPLNPLAKTTVQPTVTIGGVAATNVQFSGLTPGAVSLYQVNVQIPDGAPTGDQVPVVITIGGVTSNSANIAVDAAQ
jgi:uncharacterized protein (TIGR03437 family)